MLRRRAGESLLIGKEIEIEFLEVGAQAVKIGIKAPKHIPILRKELQLVRAQNQVAAQTVDLTGLTEALPKISS